jgi:hypothetical protein
MSAMPEMQGVAASDAPLAPPSPEPTPGHGDLRFASLGGEPTSAAVDTRSERVESDRVLVYRAELHVAVYELGPAFEAGERIAKSVKGYLLERTDSSLVLRIPTERLEAVLGEFGALGVVTSRHVQAEDVTEKFRDLTLRLKNARAVRDRLEQLLMRAGKVEDALEVEKELARLSEEIERYEGQLTRLGELIRYSTVTLHLSPREVEQVSAGYNLPFRWLDRVSLGRLLEVN